MVRRSENKIALLNLETREGNTPLHYAALIGNAKCVALLIKAGANVHQVAEGYCRPIDAARGRRRLFPAGTSVSKKQGEKVVKLL